MSDTPDLSALIGSRICHDLISPIGAIGNGVELLMMEGRAGPEVALIAESVAAANARIRFFRLAFGATGPQPVSRAEVAGMLADLTRGGRLSVEWQPATDQPRGMVKLALLSFMCMETLMPYGGRIVMAETEGRWTVTGTSEKFRAAPDWWLALEGAPPAGITAAQVQFLVLPQEARDQGRSLTAARDAGRLLIAF